MGDWTGTVPTFTAGAHLRGVDQQTLADIATAQTAALTSYVPVWRSTGTQPALVNGTITGAYRRTGKHVNGIIELTIGSSTTFGTGTYYFDLPFTSARENVCIGRVHDSSVGSVYTSIGLITAKSSLPGLAYIVPLTASTNAVWTSAAPMTWATADTAVIHFDFDTA